MYSQQDLEDVEQQAYARGYSDCEACGNFVRNKCAMAITHAIVAIVALVVGALLR